jgi:NAD(P)-dependent dehydrogenase (short-subunit alcohol dehydrogenase family)
MGLENKVAIVTGGGAGIGEALWRELARCGAASTVRSITTRLVGAPMDFLVGLAALRS